ncbi:MAG: hypothetical protein FWC12_10185 [Treponema sp.]|nr:hypothetical protein [Treponema sp.]
MKLNKTLCVTLLLIFFFVYSNVHAQTRDDSNAARQYFNWVKQAYDEGRIEEAYTALYRVSDFSDVSSDISYLLAVTRLHYLYEFESRLTVINALENAIQTNRWETYRETQAYLLKIEQLIAVRDYMHALNCIDQIRIENASDSANITMLRLQIFKGMATHGDIQALAQFRSQVLVAMDRFPRDSRPLRIFFEYARNKNPFDIDQSLSEADIHLLELALRRLPFLIETDPELAWLASPFMRNLEDARRLLGSYRSGGIPHIQNRDFMPHPASLPIALNLGLIGDIEATDELFNGSRGFNYLLYYQFHEKMMPKGDPILDKRILTDVYNLLRSEDGRNYFTRKLLSFSGLIITDDDNDGYVDTYTIYKSGVVQNFESDTNQDTVIELGIVFKNGVPDTAVTLLSGRAKSAFVQWEQYPFVKTVVYESEEFSFRPADFQFIPIDFIQIGGSRSLAGFLFPVKENRKMDLSYPSLVFSCTTISRNSLEIDDAVETFYMVRGIPVKAVEILNGMQISITQFERGYPVIQNIDLDIDGRMETTRRFRRPSAAWYTPSMQFFNYRDLIASSESDWNGDGKHITKEVYLEDGSVVYSYDIDGSGEFNHSESGK